MNYNVKIERNGETFWLWIKRTTCEAYAYPVRELAAEYADKETALKVCELVNTAAKRAGQPDRAEIVPVEI